VHDGVDVRVGLVQAAREDQRAGDELVVAGRAVGPGVADEDDLLDVLGGLLAFVVEQVALLEREKQGEDKAKAKPIASGKP